MRLESLKKDKEITLLFNAGHSEYKYPIKILYKISDAEFEEPHIQLAVTAPKRNFPRAVDRNLLKRRMREAFRNAIKNSNPKVYNNKNIKIFLIYTSRSFEEYHTILRSIDKIIPKIFY